MDSKTNKYELKFFGAKCETFIQKNALTNETLELINFNNYSIIKRY